MAWSTIAASIRDRDVLNAMTARDHVVPQPSPTMKKPLRRWLVHAPRSCTPAIIPTRPVGCESGGEQETGAISVSDAA